MWNPGTFGILAKKAAAVVTNFLWSASNSVGTGDIETMTEPYDGADAEQPTAADRGTYVASDQGGNPIIEMDASDHYDAAYSETVADAEKLTCTLSGNASISDNTLYLDGTLDAFRIDTATGFDGQVRTFEMDVLFSVVESPVYLYTRNDTSGGDAWEFHYTSGALHFTVKDGSTTTADSDAWTPSADTVYRLCVEVTNKAVQFYVDGVDYGSDTVGKAIPAITGFYPYVGARNTATGLQYELNGEITGFIDSSSTVHDGAYTPSDSDFDMTTATVALMSLEYNDASCLRYNNGGSVDFTEALALAQPIALNFVSHFAAPTSDQIMFGDANAHLGVGSDGLPFIRTTGGSGDPQEVKLSVRQIEASDDFPGTELNTNRWVDNTGTQSVSSGELVQSTPGRVRNALVDYSGDFEIIVKYSAPDLANSAPSGKIKIYTIFMGIGGAFTSIFNRRGSDTSHVYRPRINGTYGTDVNTTDYEGYYKINRTGNTVTLYKSTDGDSWDLLQTGSVSGSIDNIDLTCTDTSTTTTLVGYTDYITILDGSDDPILIDDQWDDGWHVISANIDGANSSIKIDGADEETGTLSDSDIAATSIGSGSLALDYGEAAVYDSSTSADSDVNRLKTKWDI